MLGLGNALPLTRTPLETPYVGPLDAVASKVLVAYGTVRLFSSNAEGLNVRRSSDSAAADVGTLNNGEFDATTFTTHVGGGSGYAATWYDQAGTADATQGTAGAQPQVDLTGVNGRAGVGFFGGGKYLNIASFENSIGAGDYEFWCVFKPYELDGSRPLFGGAMDRLLFYCSYNNAKLSFWDVNFGPRSFDTVLSSGTTYLARFYRASGVVACELNGVAEASTHTFTTAAPSPASFGIGTEQAGSNPYPYSGTMMAAVLFKQALTSEEAGALTVRLKTIGGIS